MNETTVTTTITTKPPCFRHKCCDCSYKDTCANAFKEQYYPCYPTYPWVTPTYPWISPFYYTTSNTGGQQ